MAATEVSICNLALGRAGDLQFISSLSEATEQARACAVYYPHARDTALASHPWSWAAKRALLALLPAERTEWDFVYALPSDYVARRKLVNEANVGQLETFEGAFPFEIEGEGDDAVLLTNQADAELLYTRRVTSAAAFPPLFQEAVAWLLAADLVLAIAKKPRESAAARAVGQVALLRAAAADQNQRQASPPAESEFIRARR
jgi:hypothetical protein